MAKPSTKGLLKQISSDDIERIYMHISNKAVEWAIAGFIDEANYLLEKLWAFNIPHSGHLWLPDEGLQVLWTLSDKRPVNIPFYFKDISKIEQENWSRVFYPCGDEESRESILSKPFTQLNDNELFFKAINSGYDNSEKAEDILAALKKIIKTENAVGYSYFHSTSCGALLAARNNLKDEAEYFIKVWGEGYLKYWNNYMLAYLMRDRKCAAYLLNGILAPVFKLTQEIIQSETKEIIDVLSNRMFSGRTLVYKKLSWKQLLNNISKVSIKQKTIDFTETILKNKSLRKTPATYEEINEAEKRLNLVLPDDYKKFLLVSNGFECFSYTGVTLASVDKIDFLVKVDEQLVDIWADSMDELDTTFGDKLRSSIIIAGLEEEQQLLLIPLQNDSWECWHFSSWRPGEVVYESFRFYMEGELQSLEDELHVD
jgi:hypothetical protein